MRATPFARGVVLALSILVASSAMGHDAEDTPKLRRNIIDRFTRNPADEARIRHHIQTLGADGAWPEFHGTPRQITG